MPARNCSSSILLENKELPHGQVEASGGLCRPYGAREVRGVSLTIFFPPFAQPAKGGAPRFDYGIYSAMRGKGWDTREGDELCPTQAKSRLEWATRHSTCVAIQLSRIRQFGQSGLGLGAQFFREKCVAGNGGGKRRLRTRPFGCGHANTPHDIAFAQHAAVGLAGDLFRHLED